jgi:hypothetical protein
MPIPSLGMPANAHRGAVVVLDLLYVPYVYVPVVVHGQLQRGSHPAIPSYRARHVGVNLSA